MTHDLYRIVKGKVCQDSNFQVDVFILIMQFPVASLNFCNLFFVSA